MEASPGPWSDDGAMARALEAAKDAGRTGDVPIGAVALFEGRLVAVAGNRREADQDPTAHAEILVLRAAAAALGRWRLSGVSVFVTLEPCAMCAGALVNARVDRVVIATMDEKAGAIGSRFNLAVDPRLNHEIDVTYGLGEQEASELLTAFFEQRRSR